MGIEKPVNSNQEGLIHIHNQVENPLKVCLMGDQ